MPEYVTLYLTRALDIDDVRAVARSASVSCRGDELATVQLPAASITINGGPPEGGLQRHLLGLTNYIGARCEVRDLSLLPRVRATVQVLGIVVEPGLDRDVRALVGLLAERGNGFLFLPHGIYIWYGLVMAVPREVAPPAPTNDADAEDDEEDDEESEDEDPEPPTPERVLRRAWCLASLAWCGLHAERGDRGATRTAAERVRAWIDQVGLDRELELHERELLASDPSTWTRQQIVDATWLTEGVAVLAWGLRAYDLPDHETKSEPAPLFASIGFMTDLPAALVDPTLRSHDEMSALSDRQLGLHWRLRDFSVNGKGVDLVKLAAGEIWFGGFDLTGVAISDNDLAIGGVPIVRADADRIQICQSIAMERRRASDWLIGLDAVYSEIDMST